MKRIIKRLKNEIDNINNFIFEKEKENKITEWQINNFQYEIKGIEMCIRIIQTKDY